MSERVIVDPEVMAGKPIIKGTRIPVDAILRALAEGMSMKELLEDYPLLTEEDIKDALVYSAKIISSEDVFPLMSTKVKKGAEISGG
jgi:uncharacterized protein (DUF433 family)